MSMRSAAQAEASRSNGEKSAGPVTPVGKAAASSNAARHGLQARALLLPGESLAEYEQVLSAWMGTLQPTSEGEVNLVAGVADLAHRLHRLLRVEENQFRETLDQKSALSPSAKKLKTANDARTALPVLVDVIAGGKPKGQRDEIRTLIYSMRVVADWVDSLLLTGPGSRALRRSVEAMTIGNISNDDAADAGYKSLAEAALAVIGELEAEVPRLSNEVQAERLRLGDQALIDDGPEAKKLERHRANLQRALERQLGLLKQVRELSTLARPEATPMGPIQVELRVLGRTPGK